MFRRNFINLAAFAFSAPAFAQIYGDKSDDYDLIVVGSGAAGLCVAISAFDHGVRKIVVLEKLPILGGTSAISGGAVAVSQTDMQKRMGISDTDEEFFEDLIREGGYRNDPKLVEIYITEVRKQFEWLGNCGIHPSNIMAAAGMSKPRSHMFNPNQMMNFLLDEVSRRKIEIKTGTRAVELLQKGLRICGVRAVSRKSSVEFCSKYGVVLATGGFARNQALMNKFAPHMFGVDVVSGIGSEGDGILMAVESGGQVAGGETVTASFGFAQNPSTVRDFSTIFYSGAIILNRSGKRFVDESLPYKSLGEAFLNTKEACAYILFDESIRKAQMRRRPVDKAMWSPYDNGQEPGYCFRADTVKAVADKAGLNPIKVAEEVARYNAYVSKGRDPEFGRTSLSSGYGQLKKINVPPFYIMPAIAVVPGTYCGLKVDEQTRVLRTTDDPIEGLFAAGEIMGGFHGKNFVTGTGLGKALAFGRVAGKNASL